MLTISKEQHEMFERMLFEKMQARIESAIAQVFPETCAEPAGLDEPSTARRANEYGKAVVEKGIEAAVALGVEEEADLKAFIALGLALRRGSVPTPSWMTQWLSRPDAAGPVKLAVIESRLRQLGTRDPQLHAISESVSRARGGDAA